MPIFVSYLRSTKVRDKDDRVLGQLKDLIIHQGTTMPEISGIVVGDRQRQYYVPFSEVASFEQLVVRLSEPEQAVSQIPPPDDRVYLIRDLLDAQVVDITGAKLVRVNDVILNQVKDHLLVSGIEE